MSEQSRPNRAANQEQAEGSRENIPTSRPGGANPSSNDAPTSGSDEGGGITNRPLEEEQSNQAAVPPRGQNKHDAER